MAVYDLLQLDITLTANGIPQAVRAQIEEYLYNHNFFNGGSDPLHDAPHAEVTNTQTPNSDVEWLGGAHITVTTDANLNYILDAQAGNDITINGGANDIGVSILGNTHLTLNDAGDDSISANGGGNTIDASGSSGDVTVRGSSSGSDTIFGGSGHDVLIAAQGGGEVRSGSTNAPGSWNVLIDENATGATALIGGGGADTIYAQGNDTLHLGTGDNQAAWALGGSNTLIGGSGADQTLRASGSGVAGPGFDIILGGTGNNFLWADGTAGSGKMFSRSDAGGNAHVLDNESTNSWTMVAGEGNDTIYSGDGSDVLATGFGAVNQQLVAGGGDDLLISRTTGGITTLYAGTGNDTLDASTSSGINVFYIGYGNETVKGGSGFDYFNDTSVTGSAGSSSNVINVTGQSGDILHFTDRTAAEKTGDNISGGIRTIDFSDGQQYKVSAVVTVEFHS